MAQVSGSLITRNYTEFRGVDFTGEDVAIARSPDSLNMWKNYKTLGKKVETRPDIDIKTTIPGESKIFGMFFYETN